MTRGKHGNKAANREQATLQREAPLRNEIQRLTTKLEKAEQSNLAQQAAHIEETRKMRTLIAANTSERVEDLEARLTEMTAERDLARAEVQSIAQRWNSVSGKLIDHFRSEFGMDTEAAMKTLILWVGSDVDENFELVTDEEAIAMRKFGAAGVQALRRARRGGGKDFTVGV